MTYRRSQATDEEDELDLLVDGMVDLAEPRPRGPSRYPPPRGRPRPTGPRPNPQTWRSRIRALIPQPAPADALRRNSVGAIDEVQRLILSISLAIDSMRINPADPDEQQVRLRLRLRRARDLLRQALAQLRGGSFGLASVTLRQAMDQLG
jgi:hypothetical protein